MINVGIIGFGYMGHFHYNKARELEKTQVIAICDTDEKKLEEAINSGMRAYLNTDIDRFLKEKLDLVVICTQNQFHKYYAVKALEAGINVLCEKPVTLNTSELEEILKAQKNSGKIFTVHQQRRFDTDFEIVNEVVNDKTIGNIHTIESRIMGERGVCFGWRADPEAGGGMLYDWGVHLIDQMLKLFPKEKVTSISARLCSILTPAVDDYFELNLQFSHNVYAKIMVCTFALQKLPRWFVFGDRGALKLDDIGAHSGGMARIKAEVTGFDSVVGKKGLGPSRTMAPLALENREDISIPHKEADPYIFWNNLINSIEGKEKPFVNSDDLLRQMRIVDTAFEASRTECIIKTNI